MNKPRAVCAFLFGAAVLASATLFIFNSPIDVRAQQNVSESSDTARGIKLYQQGGTIAAIEALTTAVKNRKDDADAWCYLGLALNRGGHAKNARKAFETAVKLKPDSALAHTGLAYTLLLANKLRDAVSEAERALALNAQNAEAHYIIGAVRFRNHERLNALKEAETALQINPNSAPALLLKSHALIGAFLSESTFVETTDALRKESSTNRWDRLKEATQSLEKYIKLSPNSADAKLWREQLEALRVYAEDATKPESERTVFRTPEVTTKARLLKKPEAAFTEEARRNGVSGTVVLLAILAADGSVKNIIALQSLPSGLTQQAIMAARKIKFEPAVKDNRPVSVAVQIEYSFNFY